MAFFVGLLAVVALSVLPQGAVPHTGLSDKVDHMAAYAALALAGGIAFRGARSLFLLALGLLALGSGLELVQALIPDRYASGYDILANAIGIALGTASAAATNRLGARLPSTAGPSR